MCFWKVLSRRLALGKGGLESMWCCCILLLVSQCFSGLSFAEEPLELELQLARAAHAARVKLIESVQFSWSGEYFQVTEEISLSPEEIPRPVGSYPFSGTLTMRGSDMRLDVAHVSWHLNEAVTLPLNTSDAYHNNIGRHLTESTQDNVKRGKITAVDPVAREGLSRKSLFLAYGANPDDLYGDHVAALRMQKTAAGKMLVVGNTDYNRPRWVGATRTEYYLDPHRDFLPVRHVVMLADGQTFFDTSIDYEEHDVVGFAPVRIKSIQYKMTDLAVIESTWDFLTTSFELNLDLKEGFFEIDFPVGTRVTDDSTGETYVVGRVEGRGIMVPLTVKRDAVPIQPRAGQLAGRQSPKLNVAEWVNGGRVSLEALHSRVVVLAFWDSADESATEVIETLNAVAKKHPDVAMIGVHSADGDRDALQKLAEENNVTFRIAIDKPSSGRYSGSTFGNYRVRRPPAVFIIDPNGTVRFQDIPLAAVHEALDNVSREKEATSDQYVGIGISIFLDRSTGLPTISTVFTGSPAVREGVKAGDGILEIDGEKTREMDLATAANKIRGPRGTTVKLLLWRVENLLEQE